jgi:hypothetical protein
MFSFSLNAQTSVKGSVVAGQEAQVVKNNSARKTNNFSAMTSQVDAMKTEVMSEKMQVLVLKDLLKKEGLDGSRKTLVIAFKNDLGKRYLVDSVTYKLNGEIIYQYVAEDRAAASVEKNTPQKQFETKVVPGPYTFEVQVIYRGNDSGVFSYVKDYRITREEKMAIDVKRSNKITVSAFEKGGVFADFKDRPQLEVSQN